MNGAPRIALVDDQALIRAGLRALLQQQGIDIVFEADSGESLLAQLALQPVQLVVSDIRMPGMDGIQALQALRARGDATPCLFLTTFDDSELLLEATAAGAQGFLLKDAAPEDVRDALSRIARGETLLQPVATDAIRARYRYHADAAPRELFGEREIAILRLMAGGYSNKEIANSLGVAEGTVKNHVSNILSKLGVRDRTRAVLKAFELGIV